MAVQKKLKDQGYELGPIDGFWGKKTKIALKAFQNDRSLNTTGYLDVKTLENLGIER